MTRLLLSVSLAVLATGSASAQKIIARKAAPSSIHLYWKAPDGKPWASFERVVAAHPKIRFAMNGGMFARDLSPVGLYVEGGKTLKPLRKVNNPKVNFGIQPQGVFGIRRGKAFVETISVYKPGGVTMATQSAPMLVLNGKRNPNLPVGMQLVRNGVGILPDGTVLMAVSEDPVTFHQFADWFIRQGCTSALYLDGNVSEYYVPGRDPWGHFAVFITVE
ncbi:phosphodiester glycosidase family protein [Flaviaesturariibacter terrae]